ncbi:MAG: hypothetical protein M3N08_01225 [Pseudomonadota bacterium]|nr:hypothetical protein [Pseudomonadota bacterium]
MLMPAPSAADFTSPTLVYAAVLAKQLRHHRGERDAFRLGALRHTAATDRDPGNRAGAHYLVAKVIQGKLGPKGFENARQDLVDTAFLTAETELLTKEPVATVRLEIARTLAIASYETPKEMLTKELQEAVLKCASLDVSEDYLEAIYTARRNIVSRQQAHLDSAMATDLMQTPAPAEKTSLHYLTYQTRADTILDRPDLMTPRMVVDFIRDAEKSPIGDVRAAYFFPLAHLADQKPEFRQTLTAALQILRDEAPAQAGAPTPATPVKPKKGLLGFLRRNDPS